MRVNLESNYNEENTTSWYDDWEKEQEDDFLQSPWDSEDEDNHSSRKHSKPPEYFELKRPVSHKKKHSRQSVRYYTTY